MSSNTQLTIRIPPTMAIIRLVFTLIIIQFLTINAFKIRKRIIDGSDALKGQFPYFVSLIDRNGSFHICGGSIISHWHILTAAHCLLDYSTRPQQILVISGVTEFDRDISRNFVQKLILHPFYNETYFQNDLGLLKVMDKIVYSDLVQPISIDRYDVANYGSIEATACGFGVVSVRILQPADFLMKFNVRNIENFIYR